MTLFQSIKAAPEVEAPEDREDTAPEFVGAVNPAWIPPLCDIFTSHSIYAWYRLIEDGSDLQIEECGDDNLGRAPSWRINNEDFDIETVLGPPYSKMRWVTWALEHGVSPGQPFLIRVDKPHYWTDYWTGEGDVEWEWEFLRALPRHPARAAQSWDRVMRNICAYNMARAAAKAELLALQLSDTAAFLLTTEVYWPGPCDEMTPPRGLSVTLCSSHWCLPGPNVGPGWPAHLVTGQDDEGNYAVALENLIENVKKRFPGVDPEAVRKAPRRGW